MSKNIQFSTLQIIVENAMRSNGLSGIVNGVNIEDAWKETVTVNNQTFNNPQNLQKVRDSIAQAITDTLTASAATGSISSGNTQGQQIVTEAIAGVPIPAAARVGDMVQITALSDPVFWAWITAVASETSIPFAGVSITAKITSGSTSVQIGS